MRKHARVMALLALLLCPAAHASEPLPVGASTVGPTIAVPGYECRVEPGGRSITCDDTGATCRAVRDRARAWHDRIFGCAVPGSATFPCPTEGWLDGPPDEVRWRMMLEADCAPHPHLELRCADDLRSCGQ